MKSYLIMLASSILLFISCNSTVNVDSIKNIRGRWQVTNVSYSENLVRVKAFNEFDAKCFTGSEWFFIGNNNTGTYSLGSGTDCPSIQNQKFTWYVDKQNNFILKRIFEGENARKVTEGTIYQLSNETPSSFNLSQTIDGVTITYKFNKISDK